MLQKLSYFNLVLAIVYLLVYLKSGNFNSTTGILVIIVFNWLALRSYQLDKYRWEIWHYITGLWTLYFVGYTGYGSVNVLSAALAYNFIAHDTLTYLILSLSFCLLLIIHFIRYFLANYKEMRG